ncbi:MlrC C-terminal domain-containing protein [Brachybacterium sillae]|uniref:MlrC C-terminal domain-containing protein n=1 Tax=Brachybacterium sillae TaxID=2810536 RepID=UPI003D817D0B
MQGHCTERTPSARVVACDDSPDTGRAVALRVLHESTEAQTETGLTVVVTSRGAQYATEEMFARLGLRMRGADAVVVKMGYLQPEQYDAAADWLLALTPGGVDQDLHRLGHARIARPMIPFDPEIPCPTAADLRRE